MNALNPNLGNNQSNKENQINKMRKVTFQNITKEKLIHDGYNFTVKNKLEFLSYPEFLKYFSILETITMHNLIIGINFTYGWMPTKFDFRSEKFNEALIFLNKAKQGVMLTTDELDLLARLFNNSLVGTSKLLHFINPTCHAIWDSRVYRYLTGKEAFAHSISKSSTYLDYLTLLDHFISHTDFPNVKKRIEEEVGYQMTDYRVAELIMFFNGRPS